MQKRFETPEFSLKNYGGESLDLIAQLPVSITQRGFQVSVKVMVQKGAPNHLLVGTDIQQALGFSLVKMESDSCGSDLVTGRRVHFVSDEPNTRTSGPNTRTSEPNPRKSKTTKEQERPKSEQCPPNGGVDREQPQPVTGVVRPPGFPPGTRR